MKRVAVVIAMLALMMLPAKAQMGGGGGGRRHQGDDKNSEQKKPVVDEKAYKDALKRIPEPTTKYDPWGMARAPETDKKPK